MAAPTITDFNPTSGQVGTSVTITGTDFTGATAVKFGGISTATFHVASATSMTADVPTGAQTGKISVTTPGGTATSAQNFTVTPPLPPLLHDIYPASCTVGSDTIADFRASASIPGSTPVPPYTDDCVIAFGQTRLTNWNWGNRVLFSSIPANLLTTVGTVDVIVIDTATGLNSVVKQFSINAATPTLVKVDPQYPTTEETTYDLYGTGFLPSPVVKIDSTEYTAIVRDSGHVAVQGLALSAGSHAFSVRTAPPPANNFSNVINKTIYNPTPQLSQLSPAYVAPNSGSFVLAVFATGGMTVVDTPTRTGILWNGSNTLLTNRKWHAPGEPGVGIWPCNVPGHSAFPRHFDAQIPANFITVEGSATITASNPSPQRGESNALTFYIATNPNPSPPTLNVSSLEPSSCPVESPGFTLTVNGGGFVSSSIVRVNNSNRQTTYTSASVLKAQIPSSDLASAGVLSITVFNPPPGGGTSAVSSASNFSVGGANPVPTITYISPASRTSGSGEFTLAVFGTGFNSNSRVQVELANRDTTYMPVGDVTHGQNIAHLDATILAGDVSGGDVTITVNNPAPSGGTSNGVELTVLGGGTNPVPTIVSLVKDGVAPSAVVGSGSMSGITVNGSGFYSGSKVEWEHSQTGVTTHYSSSTQMTFDLVGHFGIEGDYRISVWNAAPGGGRSNDVMFPVVPSAGGIPIVTGVSPSPVARGSSDFVLSVFGSNFRTGATVLWAGSARTTTYRSATQLDITVPAADVAALPPSILRMNPRTHTVRSTITGNVLRGIRPGDFDRPSIQVGPDTDTGFFNLRVTNADGALVGAGIGVSGLGLRTFEANRQPPWIEPFVQATSNTSITISGRSDINGVLLTFTPAIDCRVEIKAVFDVGAVTPGIFRGELLINGAAETRQAIYNPTNSDRATISQVWSVVLQGGTEYEFKLTGVAVTSGAFTVYGAHTGFSMFGVGRF